MIFSLSLIYKDDTRWIFSSFILDINGGTEDFSGDLNDDTFQFFLRPTFILLEEFEFEGILFSILFSVGELLLISSILFIFSFTRFIFPALFIIFKTLIILLILFKFLILIISELIKFLVLFFKLVIFSGFSSLFFWKIILYISQNSSNFIPKLISKAFGHLFIWIFSLT